uniref:Leucine-rich repeat-containing N-terminal plant-type domain-containing protein n=1 Tax=Solanum lycopersicum TaxID=4081 RepID=A0A3Q7EAN8_SOLLC
MFAVDPSASHDCLDITGEWMQSYSKTLSWNKTTNCCSWDGVYCEKKTGKVIELNLTCSNLRGKFDSNTSLFQLSNLKRLDLSYNNFSGSIISPKFGCIPSSIGDLIALRTLNLSHNGLEGVIPTSLQYLSVLESLDLSFNNISGEIPQQLASLTFLEVLSLSHNHLVGCIPRGKQFDTFENKSYQGNDELRGLPLSKDCGGDEGVPQATTPFGLDQGEEGDSTMISWQAILMGYGCGLIIGLSVIYIMLSTKKPTWFSRMVEKLDHKIITRMKKHKKRY